MFVLVVLVDCEMCLDGNLFQSWNSVEIVLLVMDTAADML